MPWKRTKNTPPKPNSASQFQELCLYFCNSYQFVLKQKYHKTKSKSKTECI